MKTPINRISDLKDPIDPQGRSYREVNTAKTHKYPLGALVEMMHGPRLWIVHHQRDCDDTPLYCLSANPTNTKIEKAGFYNDPWVTGIPEESLTFIRMVNAPIGVSAIERVRVYPTSCQLHADGYHTACAEVNDELERLRNQMSDEQNWNPTQGSLDAWHKWLDAVEATAEIQDDGFTEWNYCPACAGELDTGFECIACGRDWRSEGLSKRLQDGKPKTHLLTLLERDISRTACGIDDSFTFTINLNAVDCPECVAIIEKWQEQADEYKHADLNNFTGGLR
jgi:hypothetical protein